MSKIALEPNAAGTGTFTIAAPNGNNNQTFTLPNETGTILTTQSAVAAAQITGTLSATAIAPPAAGAVGSYSLAMHSTVYTGVVSGTTYAGSVLRQAGFITRVTNTSNGEYPTASADALTGTWLCLATNNVAPAYSSVQTWYASLFQRIA